jgi:hypothetical protein
MPKWIELKVNLPSAQHMRDDWSASTAEYMEKRYGKYLPENPLGIPRPGPPPKKLSEKLQRAINSSGLRRDEAKTAKPKP